MGSGAQPVERKKRIRDLHRHRLGHDTDSFLRDSGDSNEIASNLSTLVRCWSAISLQV